MVERESSRTPPFSDFFQPTRLTSSLDCRSLQGCEVRKRMSVVEGSFKESGEGVTTGVAMR